MTGPRSAPHPRQEPPRLDADHGRVDRRRRKVGMAERGRDPEPVPKPLWAGLPPGDLGSFHTGPGGAQPRPRQSRMRSRSAAPSTTIAPFEADLIRMRTREGMAIARARGELRGKQPKLSDKQQRELCRLHATGEYSVSDLAELFSVTRPTVYRTLQRRGAP